MCVHAVRDLNIQRLAFRVHELSLLKHQLPCPVDHFSVLRLCIRIFSFFFRSIFQLLPFMKGMPLSTFCRALAARLSGFSPAVERLFPPRPIIKSKEKSRDQNQLKAKKRTFRDRLFSFFLSLGLRSFCFLFVCYSS